MKRRPIPVEPPKPVPEPIPVRIIEDLLKLPNSGDSRAFTCLSAISDAGHDSIVFAQDDKTLKAALASDAGLILAPLGTDTRRDSRVLAVKNPRYVFAQCAYYFDSFEKTSIHPSAIIDPTAYVGEGTSIGAGSVIEAGAYVGEYCKIAHNVTV